MSAIGPKRTNRLACALAGAMQQGERQAKAAGYALSLAE
jgi:hypothetical protein